MLDAELWPLNPGLWTLESGRQNFKILNCPKHWKEWSYINNFILEFFIDINLWSFQA